MATVPVGDRWNHGAAVVLDQGLWQGVLHLIVLEASPGDRAYGVLAPCHAYGAFEEMIYSAADHGGPEGAYDGGVYIMEATSSRLLTEWKESEPFRRQARHFLFVAGDYCYEMVRVIAAGSPAAGGLLMFWRTPAFLAPFPSARAASG